MRKTNARARRDGQPQAGNHPSRARKDRADVRRGRAAAKDGAGEAASTFRVADHLPTAKERVDHPAHYGGADNPYEAIKVIEAWGLGFCLGNTVKYISRAGKKGSAVEDLQKARWYIDRELMRLQGLA